MATFPLVHLFSCNNVAYQNSLLYHVIFFFISFFELYQHETIHSDFLGTLKLVWPIVLEMSSNGSPNFVEIISISYPVEYRIVLNFCRNCPNRPPIVKLSWKFLSNSYPVDFELLSKLSWFDIEIWSNRYRFELVLFILMSNFWNFCRFMSICCRNCV